MKSKLSFLVALFLFLLPSALFAGEFQTIVGIPGIPTVTSEGGLNAYINALYRLSISIAALLAVIKIVAAGAKYMLSDIITHKEDAKKDIQGALIGLLIVIAAVIILNTVNSDLTEVNFNLEPIVAPTSTAPVVPVDPAVAFCNDPTQGGCTLRACDSLDDYTLEFIVGGASVGLVGGAAAGSAVPIVGNTALGLLGGLAGGVGGALVGLYAQGAGTAAECSIVCNWLEGTIVNNSCLVPNNPDAFASAEVLRIRAAIAESEGCASGNGYYVGDNYRCITEITQAESDRIFSQIGVPVSPALRTEILQLTRDFLYDGLVEDQTTLNAIAADIGGVGNVLMAVELGELADSGQIITEVETICNSIAAENNLQDTMGYVQSTINGVNYAACVSE
ncbi:MAG: hypothetical protein V4668_03870 [Patescibacteria group bacterium]